MTPNKKYSSLQEAIKRQSPASKPVFFKVARHLASPELAELVCLYAIPIIEFAIPSATVGYELWRFDSTLTLQHMCLRPWRLRVYAPTGARGLTVSLVSRSSPTLRDNWFCSATVGVHRPLTASGVGPSHVGPVLFKEKGSAGDAYTPASVADKCPSEFEFTDQVWCKVENYKMLFGPTDNFAHYVVRIEIAMTKDTCCAPALDLTALHL